MALRQEQIVLLGTVLVLGALGYGMFGEASGGIRGGDRSSAATTRKSFQAPVPSVALPNGTAPLLARELFAPPRDKSPLAPLELVEPPRERLPVLLPPTEPGPSAAAYELLRRQLLSVDLPDLFAAREESENELEDAAFLDLAGREKQKQARIPGGAAAGGVGSNEDPLADLSPAERQVMLAGYKRRYDWIQRGPGELWFGRLVNPDRYGLVTESKRDDEALQFVRLEPETGREFFKNIGAPPLEVARADIGAFGFADTVANEIDLRARRLAGEFTRSSFVEALLLARQAIEHRLEAPRALAIAEDLYRRAAAYDAKDPEPRLGLALCMEAAFRFEDAFAVYQELLQAFPHREEIHVALAALEERFLLHGPAEARLRQALAMNQSSWSSRFGLGRFLVEHQQPAEAVEHLKVANQVAPQAPELLPVRVAIRTTLGDAHLALGQLAEAEAAYRSAISADARHERAQAGLLTSEFLGGKPLTAAKDEGAGFELLLARGVAALAAGKHEEALDPLRLAAEADPLRAHLALAALSVLAEVTGNSEEALRLADEALERDPTQPFALFQKGRLLGLQDDYEGARTALLAALEQELDFEDALVALGDMAFRLGRFEDAERYLERAVAIDGGRSEVHALRGLNLLRLDSVASARASFERALELTRNDPPATAGLAWCLYLEGDSVEALTRLAGIEDQRRNLPKDDPWRDWARAQIARLQDHLQKVEWRDPFARKRLANGWQTFESDGITSAMVDGAVELAGQFSRAGKGRVYRTFEGGEFVSFEADVWIDPARASGSIGIFAARERVRRDDTEVIAEASVSRHQDGNVQLRFVRSGQAPERRDMQQPFPTGKWLRLKLERRGESSEGTITLFLDGIPLVEGMALPSLAQAGSPLLVGLFVEGDPARDVAVRMDNVSIVTRL